MRVESFLVEEKSEMDALEYAHIYSEKNDKDSRCNDIFTFDVSLTPFSS